MKNVDGTGRKGGDNFMLLQPCMYSHLLIDVMFIIMSTNA